MNAFSEAEDVMLEFSETEDMNSARDRVCSGVSIVDDESQLE
jgi:hypothetical protein